MYSYDENGNKVQLRMEEEKRDDVPDSPSVQQPPKKGLDTKAKFAIALISLVALGIVVWYFQDDIKKMFKSKSKSVKHRSSSSSAEASFGSARSSHSSDAFNF